MLGMSVLVAGGPLLFLHRRRGYWAELVPSGLEGGMVMVGLQPETQGRALQRPLQAW